MDPMRRVAAARNKTLGVRVQARTTMRYASPSFWERNMPSGPPRALSLRRRPSAQRDWRDADRCTAAGGCPDV